MGSCVDVFAPGYNILSSDICIPNSSCYNPTANECNTCQRYRTGTSQSTPIVTGAVLSDNMVYNDTVGVTMKCLLYIGDLPPVNCEAFTPPNINDNKFVDCIHACSVYTLVFLEYLQSIKVLMTRTHTSEPEITVHGCPDKVS